MKKSAHEFIDMASAVQVKGSEMVPEGEVRILVAQDLYNQRLAGKKEPEISGKSTQLPERTLEVLEEIRDSLHNIFGKPVKK